MRSYPIRLSHLYLDAAKPYVNLYGKSGNKIRTATFFQGAVEHIRIYLKAFHETESQTGSVFILFPCRREICETDRACS